MALSVSQKVILRREDTYGVLGAVGTTLALPIETANINLITDPYLDQTKRGAASLDGEVYDTVQHVEGSIEGPFFPDEAAYFLLALMGDETAVTTGTINTHSFVAKTNFGNPKPSSLSIDVRDDAQNQEFLGCYVSSFTLRFSAAEGVLTYSASIWGASQVLGANLTNVAFNDATPPFGWRGLVKRSSGAGSRTTDDQATIWASGVQMTNLIDAEFTFNRPTAPTYTARQSQNVFRADPGPLEVTARITADFDAGQVPTANTLLTEYRSNTKKGWVFFLDNNQAAGALRDFCIYLPYAGLIDQPFEVDRSETAIRVNLGMRAVHNSALTGVDASATGGPVRFRVGNGLVGKYGN